MSHHVKTMNFAYSVLSVLSALNYISAPAIMISLRGTLSSDFDFHDLVMKHFNNVVWEFETNCILRSLKQNLI